MKRSLVFLLICLLILPISACSFSIGDPVDVDNSSGDPVDDPGEDPNVDPADPTNDPDDGPTDISFGSNIAGWAHFSFQPGQFFLYDVTSDRSGDGWVSVSVADGAESGALDITCEGEWGLGEFSDTAVLTPDMNGWDLSMELSAEGTNAMMSLLDASIIPFEEVCWEAGVEITYGEKTFTCTESADFAGISGLIMIYKTTHAFTGEDLQYTYCVNLDVPLPLFVETPAANDIWRYELVDISGF